MLIYIFQYVISLVVMFILLMTAGIIAAVFQDHVRTNFYTAIYQLWNKERTHKERCLTWGNGLYFYNKHSLLWFLNHCTCLKYSVIFIFIIKKWLEKERKKMSANSYRFSMMWMNDGRKSTIQQWKMISNVLKHFVFYFIYRLILVWKSRWGKVLGKTMAITRHMLIKIRIWQIPGILCRLGYVAE